MTLLSAVACLLSLATATALPTTALHVVTTLRLDASSAFATQLLADDSGAVREVSAAALLGEGATATVTLVQRDVARRALQAHRRLQQDLTFEFSFKCVPGLGASCAHEMARHLAPQSSPAASSSCVASVLSAPACCVPLAPDLPRITTLRVQ